MADAGQRGAAGEGRRVEWLDALRGWAILGVILVHAGQNVAALSGFWKAAADAGQYGVQLFFVVSALTIGLTYERQLQRNSDVPSASIAWLIKRYFRIAPLYYYGIALYLIVFAIMRAMGSAQPANAPWDVAANLTFVHSWVPSAQNSVVPGGWSIAVEMCFYLVAPFIFLTIRSPRASVMAFIVATALIWSLDRAVVAADGGATIANNSFLYFWFPTQLPVFMAGIALYRCAGRILWSPAPLSSAMTWAVAIGTGLFAAIGLVCGTAGNLDHSLAPAALGLAFCGLALLSRARSVATVLVTRLSVALGQISYSVYINHFLAILALRYVEKRLHLWEQMPALLALACVFGSALLVAVALSLATRRFIENPGIEFGHRLAGAIEARVKPLSSRPYPR